MSETSLGQTDETAARDSTPAFLPLDPRVVGLWRASGLIGWGILLISALIGAAAVWMTEPRLAPLLIGAGAGMLLLSLWLVVWRPPRLYRSWGYRIDERVLETRSGLMFQVRRLLPLSRLQHVDLQRGPLERAFGLASLVLHTAGTHQASITIPGLDPDAAVRLRDHLLEVGGDDAV
jgi:hypothetical protein